MTVYPSSRPNTDTVYLENQPIQIFGFLNVAVYKMLKAEHCCWKANVPNQEAYLIPPDKHGFRVGFVKHGLLALRLQDLVNEGLW